MMALVSGTIGFFFDSRRGPFVAAALGVFVLFSVWQLDRYGQRVAGRGEGVEAQKQVTRHANDRALHQADRVRRDSRSSGLHGQIDPNY